MNAQNESEENVKVQKQILEMESFAKMYLGSEALIRYATLKTAYPEKAFYAVAVIAQLAKQNNIKSQLSDSEFKGLLMKLETNENKNFRIVRK